MAATREACQTEPQPEPRSTRLRRSSTLKKPEPKGPPKESGCDVGCLLLSFVATPVVVIGFFVLINGIAEWIKVKAFAVLGEKPIELAVAVLMVVGALWALARLLTGHAPPESSQRRKLVAAFVLVGIAALGAMFLIGSFAGT